MNQNNYNSLKYQRKALLFKPIETAMKERFKQKRTDRVERLKSFKRIGWNERSRELKRAKKEKIPMPYMSPQNEQTSENRHRPERCKVCEMAESLRSWIESAYEEGMHATDIRIRLQAQPFKQRIGLKTLRKHLNEHKFLRHIEQEYAQKHGIDTKAQEALNELYRTQKLQFYGQYAIPPELIGIEIDPIKKLSELFIINFVKFVKLSSMDSADLSWQKEARQLSAELRTLLVTLAELRGESISDKEVDRRAQLTEVIRQALDRVSPEKRKELSLALQKRQSKLRTKARQSDRRLTGRTVTSEDEDFNEAIQFALNGK